MSDRDRFQGLCLQSEDGWEFMSTFDEMPWEVRNELRNSPFNLCPACVFDVAYKIGSSCEPFFLIKAIREMEQMIRCEEVQ